MSIVIRILMSSMDTVNLEVGIIGQYKINENKLAELQLQWNTSECRIIGATDGGLKDHKGTSSYTIFLPNDEHTIVEGHAGEYQPSRLA